MVKKANLPDVDKWLNKHKIKSTQKIKIPKHLVDQVIGQDEAVEVIKKEQGEDNPLFKTIREHGYVRETPLIIATIGAFSRGEVKITPDKQVADAAGNLIEGYDLSAEIDEMVKGKLEDLIHLSIHPPGPIPLGKEGGIFTIGIWLIGVLCPKASTVTIIKNAASFTPARGLGAGTSDQ